MWDRWGSAHATPEQRASMAADLAGASHDLTAFIAERVERGEPDGTAVFVATQERDAWAQVRAGTLAFVDENVYYVTTDAQRYGRLFGIDPQTLERVG